MFAYVSFVYIYIYIWVRARGRVCMRVCVSVCMHYHVRAGTRVCVYAHSFVLVSVCVLR